MQTLSPKMLTVLRCLDGGKPVLRKERTNVQAAYYFVGRRRGMGYAIEALYKAGLITVVKRYHTRYWRVFHYGLTVQGKQVVEGRG